MSQTTGIVFLCAFMQPSIGGHLSKFERISAIAEENSMKASELVLFSPILFNQAIIHDEFHTKRIKLSLAGSFRIHFRNAIGGRIAMFNTTSNKKLVTGTVDLSHMPVSYALHCISWVRKTDNQDQRSLIRNFLTAVRVATSQHIFL